MKQAAIVFLLAAALATGCSQLTMTRFDHDTFHLEVGGHASGEALSAGGPGQTVYCSPDIAPRQVTIEARLVEVGLRDQSILGMDWWAGEGNPVLPTTVENTTPKPVPITMGFGFGLGGGGRGHTRHGLDCGCPQCSDAGRTSSGGGFGVGFPVSVGRGRQVTSVRITFDLPGTVHIDRSYLLVTLQIGTTQDGKAIVQPVILPITIAPKPSDEPPPTQPTTHVCVRDGGELDIGGLEITEDQARSKVPVLNDLPLLGSLFRDRGGKTQSTELLIFITPHLVIEED